MGLGSFLYNLVLLLHLAAVVVGFGSSFVYPLLGKKARTMAPNEALALSRAMASITKPLSTYPVMVAGVLGIVLVLLSDKVYKFSQAWISIAFLLFFAGVAVTWFLSLPNQQAMLALQEKLVAGNAGRPPAGGKGGPPPEVAELGERGKKAAMYSGIIHLIFLLLMIDMIWKPGSGA